MTSSVHKEAMYDGCPSSDDIHDFFSEHGPHCDVVYDSHNHTNNLPFEKRQVGVTKQSRSKTKRGISAQITQNIVCCVTHGHLT